MLTLGFHVSSVNMINSAAVKFMPEIHAINDSTATLYEGFFWYLSINTPLSCFRVLPSMRTNFTFNLFRQSYMGSIVGSVLAY